ncbi:hypothetical protein DCCM_0385 [Desulfocucumis palustris]|uniref:SLH domain-containing protein n=1 Tax=Desulfocucumis palustris TaxID=1898651 RepID=A0A2L2X8E7_9FIRM|nr:hypothetical protein [Desulfocucumis palustris]GBF32194.1 hypothetical protein DCCM_0385 [Desulfocucumis palustris]
MKAWLDVNSGDWFYNEVIEATNYALEDGTPLIAGIAYNAFVKPGFYLELKAAKGQKDYDLKQTITVTPDNPLFVYVDGVQSLYRCIKDSNGGEGGTGNIVSLYASPALGAIVSFCQIGVPRYKEGIGGTGPDTGDEYNGRPYVEAEGMYPRNPLMYGDLYYYDPQHMVFNEYCYAYGRRMRRSVIPDREWRGVDSDEKLETLLSKYIGYSNDVYVVSPNDLAIFPHAEQLRLQAVADSESGANNYCPGVPGFYALPEERNKIRSWIFMPYSLQNVTCRIEYVTRNRLTGQHEMKGGEFAVRSPNGKVIYNDRFFPHTYMLRAEAAILMNKIRKSFYARFTDYDGYKLNKYCANPGCVAYDQYHDINQDREYCFFCGSLDYPMKRAAILDETYTACGGQNVFKLMGCFDPEDASTLTVKVNGETIPSNLYQARGSSAVKMLVPLQDGDKVGFSGKREKSRFSDIPGSYPNPFYQWDIIELELETFNNGEYVLTGTNADHSLDINGQTFMPERKLTRAELVAVLNRFRKWCIEKFKM